MAREAAILLRSADVVYTAQARLQTDSRRRRRNANSHRHGVCQ